MFWWFVFLVVDGCMLHKVLVVRFLVVTERADQNVLVVRIFGG